MSPSTAVFLLESGSEPITLRSVSRQHSFCLSFPLSCGAPGSREACSGDGLFFMLRDPTSSSFEGPQPRRTSPTWSPPALRPSAPPVSVAPLGVTSSRTDRKSRLGRLRTRPSNIEIIPQRSYVNVFGFWFVGAADYSSLIAHNRRAAMLFTATLPSAFFFFMQRVYSAPFLS